MNQSFKINTIKNKIIPIYLVYIKIKFAVRYFKTLLVCVRNVG